MDIVIGYQGKDHVKAEQLRRLIAGMAGDGTYVLGTQNELAATMVTANQVRIDTGDIVAAGGAYATVETPETLTIESGATGQKRNDLVVARYEKDASTSVESMELAVVKGTAVSFGDPVDPEIQDGSIIDGDSPVEVPLWRIPIDGLAPGTPVALFETIPTIDSLRDSVSQVLWEGNASSLDVELPGLSRAKGLLFDFTVKGKHVGTGCCIPRQGQNAAMAWGITEGERLTMVRFLPTISGDRLSFEYGYCAWYEFTFKLGEPLVFSDGVAGNVTRIVALS